MLPTITHRIVAAALFCAAAAATAHGQEGGISIELGRLSSSGTYSTQVVSMKNGSAGRILVQGSNAVFFAISSWSPQPTHTSKFSPQDRPVTWTFWRIQACPPIRLNAGSYRFDDNMKTGSMLIALLAGLARSATRTDAAKLCAALRAVDWYCEPLRN